MDDLKLERAQGRMTTLRQWDLIAVRLAELAPASDSSKAAIEAIDHAKAETMKRMATEANSTKTGEKA